MRHKKILVLVCLGISTLLGIRLTQFLSGFGHLGTNVLVSNRLNVAEKRFTF